MTSLASTLLAGFLAGFIGSLGFGGGAVLVMFLTVFAHVDQLRAQGINLLFFLPVGLFALVFHIRKKLISWKTALPAIGFGLLGALLGSLLSRFFGGNTVRTIFGVMLLLLGLKELFGPEGKKLGKFSGGNSGDNQDNPVK